MNSKEILKEYHEYSETNILDKAETMYNDGYIYDVELALSTEKIKYNKVLKDLDRLEKLEKVIEILKNYEAIELKVKITEEEYNLVKEVLEDEK